MSFHNIYTPIKQFLQPDRNSARLSFSASRETFWRTLQTFSITRVVIAIVLLIYLVFNTKKAFVLSDSVHYLEVCVLYLLTGIGFTALATYTQRRFLLQLFFQITIDIAVISLLYATAGGAKSGLGILYLFPLAGGAILAPLLWALFFTSLVTLLLLTISAYQIMQSVPDISISQVGLYGAAFFAAVLVINRLASKLIKQEELAARRGKDLQLQQAINRLVIADMGDGILVVNRDGALLTANPAAERMLGVSIPRGESRFSMNRIAALAPINDAFLEWMQAYVAQEGANDDDSAFVMVKPNEDVAFQTAGAFWEPRKELAAHLKLRFVKVDAPDLMEDCTVIFLQDVTEIENQAQQLKLASMGRLTASIAHEVRNPLSAISYASSLMSEEMADPSQKRLLAIISDNVDRLNRMIEDILQLSRKAQPQNEPLELATSLAQILAEFQETHGVREGLIHVSKVDPVKVWFDPLHLREVVVNLLSNAMRYASGSNGSIRIHVVPEASNRLELHVQDDGHPITPEVRAHLFEPFYTTSSKGTGLGLYLARELCLNNGAMLDYEYHMDDVGNGERTGGRFVITLATAEIH